MKRFCNEKCCECSLTQLDESNGRKQLDLLLNILVNIYGEDVIKITNKVCPNMTCCCDCRIDDFCHTTGCEIDEEANRFAKNWKQVGDYAV